MTINNLSRVQIIILLLIAAIVSITGLDGLSNYNRDYYVSAAIGNAFFLAILLLVLSSPFLYIFRKREKVELPQSESKPKTKFSWRKVFVVIFVLLITGGLVGVIDYINTRQEPKPTPVVSNNCPQIQIENRTVQKISKIFDPTIPPVGEHFYLLSTETNPWSLARFVDVDGDGKDEIIRTANTAMYHTPHVLKILKNNYVIFEAEGAGLDVEEIKKTEQDSSGKGFYLIETVDWINNIVRRTRFIYENGGFTPAWYQESKNCDLK